jgi:hypothetical protein
MRLGVLIPDLTQDLALDVVPAQNLPVSVRVTDKAVISRVAMVMAVRVVSAKWTVTGRRPSLLLTVIAAAVRARRIAAAAVVDVTADAAVVLM